MLATLVDVGLGYLTLGQPSTTLSGGEAQRIKLATELAAPARATRCTSSTSRPPACTATTSAGCSCVLNRLVDQNNSVLVIEHNLDVIKTADWVIDLGPEGGAGGGRIVAAGTPEEIAACEASHTGQFLRAVLRRERSLAAATRPLRLVKCSPMAMAPRTPGQLLRTSLSGRLAVIGHGEHPPFAAAWPPPLKP